MTSSGTAYAMNKNTGLFLLTVVSVCQINRKLAFGCTEKIIEGDDVF
jgi:hypothetical protein